MRLFLRVVVCLAFYLSGRFFSGVRRLVCSFFCHVSSVMRKIFGRVFRSDCGFLCSVRCGVGGLCGAVCRSVSCIHGRVASSISSLLGSMYGGVSSFLGSMDGSVCGVLRILFHAAIVLCKGAHAQAEKQACQRAINLLHKSPGLVGSILCI